MRMATLILSKGDYISVTTEIEKMEMKEEEKEEVEKMEIDEIKEEEDKEMKMEDESKEGSITPTPLNENKSKKYSKFDSSPESNEVPDSPYQSEVDYGEYEIIGISKDGIR